MFRIINFHYYTQDSSDSSLLYAAEKVDLIFCFLSDLLRMWGSISLSICSVSLSFTMERSLVRMILFELRLLAYYYWSSCFWTFNFNFSKLVKLFKDLLFFIWDSWVWSKLLVVKDFFISPDDYYFSLIALDISLFLNWDFFCYGTLIWKFPSAPKRFGVERASFFPNL